MKHSDGLIPPPEYPASQTPAHVKKLVRPTPCMNILTPDRLQTRGTSSMRPNSCLVQIEKWQRADAFARLRAEAEVAHG